MKKYGVVALVILTLLIVIMGMRKCTKTKILSNLKTRAETFDRSLNSDDLTNFDQFMSGAVDYLKTATSSLGRKNFLTGYYLSKIDKEIIIDNVFNRLLKTSV